MTPLVESPELLDPPHVEDSAPPLGRWPDPLEPAALHGVAGEFVRRLEPHTEADPAAILFQFLVGAGNLVGRTAHFIVEDDKHFCNMEYGACRQHVEGTEGGFVATRPTPAQEG